MEDKINSRKLLVFSIFLILSVSLVSAQNSITGLAITDDLADLTEGTLSLITDVSSKVLGDMGGVAGISSEALLFARLLLLIILITIIFSTLGKVDLFAKSKSVLWIISLGVGILAVRFFSAQMVATVLIPYTALGFAVTAIIPFVIFFFLVNVGMKENKAIVRRVAWIFFAVVFIGLWIKSPSGENNFKHIYLVVAVVSVIMMKLDGTISRFFKEIEIEGKLRIFDDKEYFRRKKENEAFYDSYLTLVTTGDEGDYKKAKEIAKKIANNEEDMEELAAGNYDKSANTRGTWKFLGDFFKGK